MDAKYNPILEKIESLLPESLQISIIDNGGLDYPDVILSYKETPIALLDFKESSSSFYSNLYEMSTKFFFIDYNSKSTYKRYVNYLSLFKIKLIIRCTEDGVFWDRSLDSFSDFFRGDVVRKFNHYIALDFVNEYEHWLKHHLNEDRDLAGEWKNFFVDILNNEKDFKSGWVYTYLEEGDLIFNSLYFYHYFQFYYRKCFKKESKKKYKIEWDKFIEQINELYNHDEEISPKAAEQLVKKLRPKDDINNYENFTAFIESLSDNDYQILIKNVWVTKAGSLVFSREFENMFFLKLLGSVKNASDLCRYTSYSTFILNFKDAKTSMLGLACQNDKSECYYVDQYLNDPFSGILLDKMKYHQLKKLNSYFITSCVDDFKCDDLTMWRLYGDNTKGVCLKYKIDSQNNNNNFYLAPVSYAKTDGTHPELDYIKRLQNAKIRIGNKFYSICFRMFDVWKHFFKPNEYAVEQEIRLLYEESIQKEYKWITNGSQILCPLVEFPIDNNNINNINNNVDFPLILDEILLGPNCPEKNTNAAELRVLSKAKNIKWAKKIKICHSKV